MVNQLGALVIILWSCVLYRRRLHRSFTHRDSGIFLACVLRGGSVSTFLSVVFVGEFFGFQYQSCVFLVW